MIYHIQVVEISSKNRQYVIDADSRKEAIEKALKGDTVEEYDISPYGDVIDRVPAEDSLLET